MSKFTLELRFIAEDTSYNLFDFDYNLYDNSLKEQFQKRFFEHFYFYEIGLGTVEKFKYYLKSTLNDIYPYYKQLYETELRCKDIDFMLNKDLKESYIRELQSDSFSTSVGNSSSNSESNSNGLNTSHEAPQKRIDNLDNYVNGAEKSKVTSNDTLNSNSTSESNVIGNNVEKYELISQGNIGVTSSAELLDKWRSVLINIDMMIFTELESLFMLVY